MRLDCSTYNARESQARTALSNDHIRAFSPVTFDASGYPARAENDAAIIRFVDTMQELNDPRRHHEADNYTPEEAALVSAVNEHVLAETHDAFGRAVRPWMGPLSTMPLFRAIETISSAIGRKLIVLEIGPGSGYLGALLLANGHQYWSTDIAQGFYLWQSRLMRRCADDNFVEGALQDAWPYRAKAVHIPWWHFATIYRSAMPTVDLVVSDHALGEMHPYALRFVTEAARNMLANSMAGYVVYTSLGEPRYNSEEAVRLNFGRVNLARRVTGKVTLFCREGHELPADVVALADAIPLFNPTKDTTRLKGRDFVPIRETEAPPSYELYRFLGFEVPRLTTD